LIHGLLKGRKPAPVPALTTFCVVRRTEGRLWFDTSSISGDRDECARIARDTDSRIPGWAATNVIVDVRPVVIEGA